MDPMILAYMFIPFFFIFVIAWIAISEKSIDVSVLCRRQKKWESFTQIFDQELINSIRNRFSLLEKRPIKDEKDEEINELIMSAWNELFANKHWFYGESDEVVKFIFSHKKAVVERIVENLSWTSRSKTAETISQRDEGIPVDKTREDAEEKPNKKSLVYYFFAWILAWCAGAFQMRDHTGTSNIFMYNMEHGGIINIIFNSVPIGIVFVLIVLVYRGIVSSKK